MKLTHCWSVSAVLAATLIFTASPPLMADEGATPQASVDTADLSDTDQRDFAVGVLGLFNAGRFADLDTLAQQLQQQRSRFVGGAWRLHWFFQTLSSPGAETATDAAWQAQIAKLIRDFTRSASEDEILGRSTRPRCRPRRGSTAPSGNQETET